MKRSSLLRTALAFACVLPFAVTTSAAEPAAMSAADLASKLSAQRQDGSTIVRLKMEIEQPVGTKKGSMQLQIKSRRTSGSTELVYQVLWPKERKGEAVLLRKSGGAASGVHSIPGSPIRKLGAGDMNNGIFDSALTYEDILEDFFAWPQQTITGTEEVGRVNCQILQSKSGSRTVRTWVDTKRMVPLRIEKSGSGQPRILETEDVVSTDKGGNIPARLSVKDPGKNALTILDGSKIKYDVSFTDRDFAPETFAEMPAAKTAE